jgi:rhamnose transport system permease protein
MQDTCQIGVYSRTFDSFGEPVPLYTYGAAIVCGFDPKGGQENWRRDMTPVHIDATIRLPIDTALETTDRLKIITRFGVPPLIATLATLALYRGLAEGISEARSVRGYPEWFFFFGQGEVLGVPFQLWILGFATVIAAVILGFTPFGRATYAIGANETAARFSGIRVRSTKLWIYTAAGFCSALAAVIFVSRVTTTRSDMGTGLELDVITGVVLGGTSIFGGRGTIIGTVLGLILIQALKNGLALSGVKGDGTIVVIGLVLIGAILAGALFDRNRGG